MIGNQGVCAGGTKKGRKSVVRPSRRSDLTAQGPVQAVSCRSPLRPKAAVRGLRERAESIDQGWFGCIADTERPEWTGIPDGAQGRRRAGASQPR